MKKLIAPLLLAPLLLAGVLLSGCAGAPTKTAPSVPMPNAAQRDALMKELAVVSPELAHPRVIARARALCPGILQGAPEAEQLMLAREIGGRNGGTVSDEQAGQVVAIIKTNGFCAPA